MFSRNVKFQVDIASTHSDTAGDKMHCVTFTLVAGEPSTCLCVRHIRTQKAFLTC